jgi:hypothetical protein
VPDYASIQSGWTTKPVYHMSDPETPAAIVEFTAAGPAHAVAAAIEAYAAERRVVSALVVPWESDAVTLRMAVTSMKSEGWAIEHTNLGTISLADLGGDLVRIAVVAAEAGSGASSLTTFARQIERKFSATSSASGAPEAP